MKKNPVDRTAHTEYGRYHRMAADGFEIVIDVAGSDGQSSEPQEGRPVPEKPEPVEPPDGRKPRVERGRYSKLLAEGNTLDVEVPAVQSPTKTAERRSGTPQG